MFRLDAMPKYSLARPPLVQALVDLRFPVQANLASMAGIAPIQQHLSDLFPYMKQQQQQSVSLLLGPGGPTATETQSTPSWSFDDDNGWSLTLTPSNAVLSIGSKYSEFGEFSKRFEVLLEVLAEYAYIPRADRLGVRYINVAEVPPDDERSWCRWFRPELTGWAGSELISDSTRLVTSLAQTQLAAPPVGELSGPPVDVQAIIRHGLIPANTIVPGAVPIQPQRPAYIIDIDFFVDAPQSFDPKELTRQVTLFHEQIDRFFFWAITDEGADYFGKEARHAHDNTTV
jgi:uncharacterized protein (TIGR04255 family)